MSAEYFDLDEPKTYTRTATKFSVVIASVNLNISCRIFITLYDIEGFAIHTRGYILEGKEYTDWTSDQYIIDYVQKKLNEE
jgi:hypothetical protein